jgi:sulfite exporter TauE/SafE
MDMTAPVSLGAALAAGIAASGHCVGMCGGIAGALAMRDPESGAARRLVNVVGYNLARVTSYVIAGSVAGLAGSALLGTVAIAPLAFVFRVLSGIIMLAAAGKLLFGWRLLDPVESGGARLWQLLAPWARRSGARPGLAGTIGLGLAWGWLPCGMTYSMLLLAATTASAATGAGVMLAFGIGTLPSMVTAGVAFDRVAKLLSARTSLRRVAGVLLALAGLWTAGYPVSHAFRGASHVHHAPATATDAPAQEHAHQH